MARNFAAFLLAVCLIAPYALAQGETEDYEAKLKAVRQKRTEINNIYRTKLQKVTKEGDEKLIAIKKDFHAKRDACLKDITLKQSDIAAAQKDEIAPLNAEERRLLELLAPAGGSNFAKPKALRNKEK